MKLTQLVKAIESAHEAMRDRAAQSVNAVSWAMLILFREFYQTLSDKLLLPYLIAKVDQTIYESQSIMGK